MKRTLFLAVIAVTGVATAAAATIQLNHHQFTLPEGYSIEQVAGPDLAPRPVSAALDDQGRLYVTDSSGSNRPPKEQLKSPDHRLLRLEDTDGDGRYDKTTVFAEKVMFPQGCLWHEGSVYVAGPPSIWKFTDTDGDGVADRREEWYKGGVLTGCANDVHGPYTGPDGRIYWTKGAFERLNFKDSRGRPINDRCAHIFRARPDGSGLEVIMSGGMDNPVDVALNAEGETFFSSTFIDLEHPGTRDGLGHAVHGGVFGKQQDAVEEPMVRRTGGLMPVMTHFGPAAACGLHRYEGDHLGVEFRDNLFATLFNLHKVTRHTLEPKGASYQTKDADFVVSDSVDFHPTDVLEDADGTLLIVDTGGWYKLCCPTSQLAKPDVLGAIYRVRRTGSQPVPDPRGAKLEWDGVALEDLVQRLSDPRSTVRSRSLNLLAKAPAEGLKLLRPALAKTRDSRQKQLLLWAIARIGSVDADPLLRSVLKDPAPAVRQTALKAFSLLGRAPAEAELNLALKDANPAVVRTAAEVAGKAATTAAIPGLLQAASRIGEDRFLEHSIAFALGEIGDAQPLRELLGKPAGRQKSPAATPSQIRVALLALNLLDRAPLHANEVLPFLNHSEPGIRDTAIWIARRHGDWGTELAGWLRSRLDEATPANRAEVAGLIAQFARSEAVQALLAETARSSSSSVRTITALDVMSQAGLRDVPAPWRAAVAAAIERAAASGDADQLASALRTARAFPALKEPDAAFADGLRKVAAAGSLNESLRLEALAALPGNGNALSQDLFGFLQTQVAASKPVTTRTTAANVLSRARLTPDQLAALTSTLQAAGPLELPRLLAAYEAGGDETLGMTLLQALTRASSASVLRPDLLRLAKFPESVQAAGKKLLATLNTDGPQQAARLDALAAELKAMNSDIRRGQAIFNSAKAACSSCHRLGYLGGNLGPDLTSISGARTERDLLEAIVYPSASFVRSYEPMMVKTRDGEEQSGVIRSESPEGITLATGPGAEVRINRADVTDIRPGAVSVMPAGLDEMLTRQELADLLAFLKNTKWGAQ